MARIGSWLAFLLLLGAAASGNALSLRLPRQASSSGAAAEPASSVELQTLASDAAAQPAAGDAAPAELAAAPTAELAATPGGAAPAPEPLALDTTAAPGSCISQLTYSDVFPPADAKAQYLFRVIMQGTRNFSCTSQPLQFGPAMGLGTARGVLQDGTQLTCVWYYSSPFEGYLDCADEATGNHMGTITLDTTVHGSVFVLPAPRPDQDEPWGRFRVKADGTLPPATLSVRHNTTGGLRPKECTKPRGEWETVPVGATFDYYYCP